MFVCGKDNSHWIEWVEKIITLSSKNSEMHSISGKENLQTVDMRQIVVLITTMYKK